MDPTPTAVLLAQIAVILAMSRVLGLLTQRLAQPMVVAEMVAGIVLGPSLLGLVWPAAFAALFPASSMEVLKVVNQLGLVLFMFVVGLELDPALLRGHGRAAVAISHSSIALPLALGVGAAWWLRVDYRPPEVSFLPFALFLGTAMSVTAFPVLARILADLGLARSRVGAIAIACAAVDDVTAWCLLAVVVAIAKAGHATSALPTIGLATAFTVLLVLVVRPLLRRWRDRVTTVPMAVFLLLVASATTELIGIHALFGGFLLGAVMPKDRELVAPLVGRLEAPAVLLLPVFFAYSGIRTQLGVLDEGADGIVTLALVALATAGKFGGSALAARLAGLSWRDANAIGVLMNTRGLMELVVLNIGMDLGILSPALFTMMVIMALATTFATTPVLRIIYKPRGSSVRPRTED